MAFSNLHLASAADVTVEARQHDRRAPTQFTVAFSEGAEARVSLSGSAAELLLLLDAAKAQLVHAVRAGQ